MFIFKHAAQLYGAHCMLYICAAACLYRYSAIVSLFRFLSQEAVSKKLQYEEKINLLNQLSLQSATKHDGFHQTYQITLQRNFQLLDIFGKITFVFNTVVPELQKRKKLAPTNFLTPKISTKTRDLRNFQIRDKIA